MELTTHAIDSPEQLSALADRLAPSDAGVDVKPQPFNLYLRLLHPLASADTLAACRNPGSKFTVDGDGNRCGPSNHEFLNLTSLTKRWRAAWATFPTSVNHVTFELVMPEPNPDVERVYSAGKIPRAGGIGVLPMHVFTFMIGLATVMNVRSRRQVSFGVVEKVGEQQSATVEGIIKMLSRQDV